MRSDDWREALAAAKPRRPHPASPEAAQVAREMAAASGVPGGDERLVMLCVRVPAELRSRVKIAAIQTARSVQELARNALESECRRHRR